MYKRTNEGPTTANIIVEFTTNLIPANPPPPEPPTFIPPNKFSTVNLSNFSPSTVDLELLEKGLSFIPTRKTLPISTLLTNQNNLIRRLKLNWYFANCNNNKVNPKSNTCISTTLSNKDRIENSIIRTVKGDNGSSNNNNNNNNNKRFTEIKTWTPRNDQLSNAMLKLTDNIKFHTSQTIDNYTKTGNSVLVGQAYSKDDVLKLRDKDNLTKEERTSLFNIKNNQDIIIKPADKGGATVIMNKENYILEAERQLNDSKYYVKLNKPIYLNNIPVINTILGNMLRDKYISKEQLKYLSGPDKINNRTFYLLPKIHKNPTAWLQPNRMPPGRPIVSDVGSETYRISEYIDSFINPLANKHPSFIKNTYEFVNKIKNFAIENNWLLVTGDIESLYTNMNIDRCIKVVKDTFNKYPDVKRPDNYILELLEISMRNNDFEFNNNFYLQIMGCAMGKRFAPGLANLYLLDFDKAAMNDFYIKPILFFRFLDDIFFLWPGDTDSLKRYETFLNSQIPDITVKLEHNNFEIPFLDTLIYKYNNKLQTKTFFKQTDTHQLLHTNSFHAKHTFLGLIKSQLIRFKRLSSNRDTYDATCKILFAVLVKRGYTLSTMRKLQHNIWLNYTDKMNSDELNGPTNQNTELDKNNDLIPIVTEYCEIGDQLAKGYKQLIKDTDFFNNIRTLTAFKNSKNLKQILVRSKLNQNPIEPVKGAGYRSCGKAQCYTCKYHANDTTRFYNKNKSESYNITDQIYCNSSNLIYLITCTKCNMQYVGETERTLRDRTTDHRSRIKGKKKTPIGIHFNLPGHSFLNLKITPIELIRGEQTTNCVRKTREKFWQTKLRTCHPQGLNGMPIE